MVNVSVDNEHASEPTTCQCPTRRDYNAIHKTASHRPAGSCVVARGLHSGEGWRTVKGELHSPNSRTSRVPSRQKAVLTYRCARVEDPTAADYLGFDPVQIGRIVHFTKQHILHWR